MKIILGLLLTCLLCGQGQAASSDCVEHNNQTPHVCSELKKLLGLWDGRRAPESVPKDFAVEYELMGVGEDTSYPNIDIDGDGIPDQIVRSCGAGMTSLCVLFVDLSSGGHLELEERHFLLVRMKSSTYVIVGDTSEPEASKRGKRRAYRITKQAIKLICSHI